MEITRIPVEVYAESTPNPAVMKFVANRRLVAQDGLEFRSIAEASKAPLAQQLFHFPFVREVFISANFVAIAKFDTLDWLEITHEIRGFVKNWLAEGRPILDPDFGVSQNQVNSDSKPLDELNSAGPNRAVLQGYDPQNYSEIELKVAEIIDEYVSPAVAQDGGLIRLIRVEDRTAKVLLQGACSGCPSSTATLQQGIKSLLVKMLPDEIVEVESING